MTTRNGLTLLLTASAIFFATIDSSADAIGPIRFGHVNAAFNAFTPILIDVELPSADVAAPLVGGAVSRGRLLPFGTAPNTPDQQHCEDDWILVNVNILSDKEQQSREEALESHSNLRFVITISGVEYESMRTPLRSASFVDPDGQSAQAWWQNDGFYLQPGALAVGTHTLMNTFFENGTCGDPGGPFPDGCIIGYFEFEILASSDPYCSG